MCSLRDAATDLAGAKIRVYGLSLDDVQSVAAFAAAQHLEFPLLSDPDGSVAAKYGVLMADRPFARRVTVVLDAEGVVRLVDDKVDVANHGRDVVALVQRLRG